MISYIKEFSETKNNKVNFEKLYIELKSSSVTFSTVEGIKGKIFVFCDEELTEAQLLDLDNFISNHDGAEPEAFSDSAIAMRENTIREINQLAIYSPYLPNNVQTVEYLTSIDNYLNAFVRSGINDVLVTKIVTDAQNPSHPQFTYLHTVVNEHGNKTYEYLIGKIQGLI